jgi:hypothetical protein
LLSDKENLEDIRQSIERQAVQLRKIEANLAILEKKVELGESSPNNRLSRLFSNYLGKSARYLFVLFIVTLTCSSFALVFAQKTTADTLAIISYFLVALAIVLELLNIVLTRKDKQPTEQELIL